MVTGRKGTGRDESEVRGEGVKEKEVGWFGGDEGASAGVVEVLAAVRWVLGAHGIAGECDGYRAAV